MDFYTSVTSIGENICVRGYENGAKVHFREFYEPSVFTVAQSSSTATHHSIWGVPLTEHRYPMGDARRFIKEAKELEGYDVFAQENFVTQYIQETFPNDVPYDTSIVDAAFIDIEVKSGDGFPDPLEAKAEIEIIGWKSTREDKYIVWSIYKFDYKQIEEETGLKVEPHIFDSEKMMLESFIEYFSLPENTPDLLTGWNSDWFDIPYLCNRILNVLGEKWLKKLSPFRKVYKRRTEEMNRERDIFQIYGVSIIDSLDAFKKFVRSYGPQASYSLDAISKVVLGEGKLTHEYATLSELAKNDPQTYVKYNVIDVNRLERIAKETNIVDLVYAMAYMMKSNISDVLGTVNIWDNKIYEYLHQNNIVPDLKGSPGMKEKFEGAYVKEPIPGIHRWMATYDLASLYPHIIVQWNMSPDTIVDDVEVVEPVDQLIHNTEKYSPPEGTCMAATGQLFSTTKEGIIPSIIRDLYNERKKAKNRMLECQKEIQDIKHELDSR